MAVNIIHIHNRPNREVPFILAGLTVGALAYFCPNETKYLAFQCYRGINSVANYTSTATVDLTKATLPKAISNGEASMITIALLFTAAIVCYRCLPNISLSNLKGRFRRPANLHEAAAFGSLKDVQLYFKRDDIDQTNSYGQTPLMVAVNNGHASVASYLIEQGADVEICDQSERTPLHVAAKNGYGGIAKKLLIKDAFVSGQDHEGRTPLMLAIARGDDALSEMILKAPGWPGCTLTGVDNHGRGPLHYAALRESNSMIETLVAAGADTDAPDQDGNTPLDLLCGADEISLEDFTALYFSDSIHSDDEKRRLLQSAYPKLRPCVRKAIEEQMSIGLSGPLVDCVKKNPLWHQESQRGITKFYPMGVALMALERHPKAKDSLGPASFKCLGPLTPKALFAAAAAKKNEVFEWGFDPNTRDKSGTPLAVHAMRFGNTALALRCLNHPDFDGDCADQKGNTPAHEAALKGASKVLSRCCPEWFCQSNREGALPLELAAFEGNQSCYRILVERMDSEALTERSRRCGLSPADYAVVLGSESLRSSLNERKIFFRYDAAPAAYERVQVSQFLEFYTQLQEKTGVKIKSYVQLVNEAKRYLQDDLDDPSPEFRQLLLMFRHQLESEVLSSESRQRGKAPKKLLLSGVIQQLCRFNRERLGRNWKALAPIIEQWKNEQPADFKKVLEAELPAEEFLEMALGSSRLLLPGVSSFASFRHQVEQGSH